jgi:guanosine-3',5'-bis(diphosphate) 3'-pyrophosphohydrolase
VLAKAVKRARGNRREVVGKILARIVEKAFASARIKARCRAREAPLRHLPQDAREAPGFAQVNDIYGFRIVVKDVPTCYLALGVLHSCTSRCRASSRTTSPSPRPTATSRCTPR